MTFTISALNVYPVKGLKGIAVDAALATPRGLEHDRRWMVVDRDGEFLSQRELPRMATIWTELVPGVLRLSAPDLPELEVPVAATDGAHLRVRVWNSVVDARLVSSAADAWLSEALDEDCRLVVMPDEGVRYSNPAYAGDGRPVGFADGYAYLVIGEASLEDLNRRLAARGHAGLPMNRFRPNIVVRGSPPYAEDGWKDIRVGAARLRVVKPCGRCQVTTTDQATGEVRGLEPLATLATYRDSAEFGVMFGMNCVTLEPGAIRVGDALVPAG